MTSRRPTYVGPVYYTADVVVPVTTTVSARRPRRRGRASVEATPRAPMWSPRLRVILVPLLAWIVLANLANGLDLGDDPTPAEVAAPTVRAARAPSWSRPTPTPCRCTPDPMTYLVELLDSR